MSSYTKREFQLSGSTKKPLHGVTKAKIYNLISILSLKVKSDHRSKFSNLINWKEEAWKNQGFNGNVEALIFSGFFFSIA